MTLKMFLQVTASAPAPSLRRAMMTALADERPTSPEGYARFYDRVVNELCTTVGSPRPVGDHQRVAAA